MPVVMTLQNKIINHIINTKYLMNSILMVRCSDRWLAIGEGSGLACGDINFSNGGYSDWFMPSLKEMDFLYQNRDKIGGFSTVEYWSSCESNANNACVMSFVTGEQLSKPKSEVRRVRVIRFF